MNQVLLWRRIEENEQRVAEEEGLVAPGERYALMAAQTEALKVLSGWLRGGARNVLLQAPTGAGKTAVAFHLAVAEFLARREPVVLLAPTRDLLRQHQHYFTARLAGTPLVCDALHGGVDPRAREALLARFDRGLIPILIASGLMLQEEPHRQRLRKAGLLLVDDLHAFDTREHLQPLRGIHAPALFMTATPETVTAFLEEKQVGPHTWVWHARPFEAPPTVRRTLKGRPQATPNQQLLLAETPMQAHLAEAARVFVVSRTRAQVPRIAAFLRKRFGVPVFELHGEMADSAEHARRLQKAGTFREDRSRVAVMNAFRAEAPAILVSTNLIGAGVDVPEADLIVVTDADGFGETELAQLVGRVGRREKPSEAYLVVGTLEKVRAKRRKGAR
ncbi:MAG: helicase-related protein [Candidatus Sericytochromatia bacterium]|nr:helicase-related protein [Candidatus Sericytochromatia bacterium]